MFAMRINCISLFITTAVLFIFLDMAATSGYILQVHGTDPVGKEIKKCLNIAVSKENGYFYGNSDFPTSICVRCLQVVSSVDEVLYISILPIVSKNCTCKSETIKREPDCSRRCGNKEEIITSSYNFPFVHGEFPYNMCELLRYFQPARQRSLNITYTFAW